MVRLLLLAVFVVPPMALLPVASTTSTGAVCYLPPVDAPVTDPFRAPSCQFCAGNRGLEYGTTSGQAVVAAAAGIVTFSGVVAHTRYVVVTQDDGLRATYGRLLAADVSLGSRVSAGALVGTATDRLFFGLRTPEEIQPVAYIDPTPLLGRWRRSSRLVPTDGGARRPARPARLVCPNTGA